LEVGKGGGNQERVDGKGRLHCRGFFFLEWGGEGGSRVFFQRFLSLGTALPLGYDDLMDGNGGAGSPKEGSSMECNWPI